MAIDHVVEQNHNMTFGSERTEGGMLLAVADKGRDTEGSKAGKRPKTLN